MKTKKIFKTSVVALMVAIAFSLGIALYLYNKPHRTIKSIDADYKVMVEEFVNEYLDSPKQANEKYLSANGESKILEVSGILKSTRKNLNGQTVLELISSTDRAGINATLDSSVDLSDVNFIIGETITVKGVIRSGASFDSDMEIYINAVLADGIVL